MQANNQTTTVFLVIDGCFSLVEEKISYSRALTIRGTHKGEGLILVATAEHGGKIISQKVS